MKTKQVKRIEAETRNLLYSAKSDQQKLALLPEDGANNQRTRLLNKISSDKRKKEQEEMLKVEAANKEQKKEVKKQKQTKEDKEKKTKK